MQPKSDKTALKAITYSSVLKRRLVMNKCPGKNLSKSDKRHGLNKCPGNTFWSLLNLFNPFHSELLKETMHSLVI